MANPHCSLSFKRQKLGTLDVFATGVREGIYVVNPTVFASPPLTQNAFGTLITDYTSAWNIFKNARGQATRGAFNATQDALLAGLITLAEFVDGVAAGNPTIIEQGGFVPTRSNTGTTPAPNVITGAMLLLGATQELTTDCDAQPQIDTYAAILTEGVPLPPEISIANDGQLLFQHAVVPLPRSMYISFSKSRKKSFTGLTVGTVYYLTMFGIGTGGVSQLCDPVKRLCN